MKWTWVLSLLALVPLAPAAAQTFPSRGITLVVSSTAGSAPDVLARAVGQSLQAKWGQNVVVENRPGGSYSIAANAVIAAPADGHTLLVSELGLYTTQPHLTTARAYDPFQAFVPVSGLAWSPLAFVAHPAFAPKSMPELIAFAKSNPGAVNYGTAGPGTAPHLGMILLEHAAQIKMTPVHYRGVSLAVNDLTAGHIQMLSIAPAIVIQGHRTGGLRILGFGSTKRVAQLSDVPTVLETIPNFEMTVSFGVLARTGTPAEAIEKANADIQEIIRSETLRNLMQAQVLQPMEGKAADLGRLLQAESEKWAKVVREANIKLD